VKPPFIVQKHLPDQRPCGATLVPNHYSAAEHRLWTKPVITLRSS